MKILEENNWPPVTIEFTGEEARILKGIFGGMSANEGKIHYQRHHGKYDLIELDSVGELVQSIYDHLDHHLSR